MKKWNLDWCFGANFYPSNAINQLEMWQEETFSPELIDRELGFAEKIGMKIMRVYLHDLLWEQDKDGFLKRIEKYLEIADKHNMKTMLVFFDDCWNCDFSLGKQPEPKPFTHNPGWLQSPGNKVCDDPTQWGRLKIYVQGVMKHFAHDERVVLWDLYNEPGNGIEGDHLTSTEVRGLATLPLLKAVFEWAQEVEVDQPITTGLWDVWDKFPELNDFILENSELISFHCYQRKESLEELIQKLQKIANGRPILCSEYMARTYNSTFQDCLPLMKKYGVYAINWGLVEGKTQTIYPWRWTEEKGMPEKYFHDVFHKDGTLLHPEEEEIFKEMVK